MAIVVLSIASHHPDAAGFLTFLSIPWVAYNRWYLAGKTGQSYGKWVVGIRLIGEPTSEPIGRSDAFFRDIVHGVDTAALYIGWLLPLWDAKRQTFADRVMNTVVVPVSAAPDVP